MDALHFLDLSGLEDVEINQINGWLFTDVCTERPLPWIIKPDSPHDNDTQMNFNGTSEPYTSAAEPINYPTQMTFIPITFNPNQLPSMYNSFIPRNYHHSPMYPNYHHPQMMGSNDNQVHYLYPANNGVYNYTQVPVSYENHQQQNNQYCSPPIQNHGGEEEPQVFNDVTNGDIINYEEPKVSVPHENFYPNNLPISNENESSLGHNNIKPDIQVVEEKPAIVSVIPSPVVKSEKIEGSSMKQNGITSNMNNPSPNTNRPKPNVNFPVPTVNVPSSNVNGPTPTVNGPTPTENGPSPKVNGPAPNVNGSVSYVDEPAPKADEPAPKADESARKADEPARKANNRSPKANDRSPKANDRSPKANDRSPKAKDRSPKAKDRSPKANDPSPKANPAPDVDVPPPNVWTKKPWVSLFKKDTPTINGKPELNTMSDLSLKKPKVEKLKDPITHRIGELIMNYQVDGRVTNLQPRGLINKSNYCYINSILQALLACPPLCNLLKNLSDNLKGTEKVKSIPMIENMCKLMDEFEVLPTIFQKPRSKKNNRKPHNINLNSGNPFEANSFYTMLNGTRSDSFLVEGRQEDAEEFLGLLLNGLNDEMMNIRKLIGNEENKHEIHQDSDDWKVMGPKNKGNITRKIQFDKTPISDIFGGLLCSKIHKTGDETTVNIQPFFTLQLNIEKADTIIEALENFTTKNQLEGLTCSKTKKTVEAWQQVMIEQLPAVLVLHLKCFDYKMDGCTKIMKTLDFPIDLKIDSKILSGRMNSAMEKQYKLFAVVYHEGKEASKGHYIADAFHTGFDSWLRYDDSKIRPISEENVLRPQGFRVPYLLFYRRCDTIKGV